MSGRNVLFIMSDEHSRRVLGSYGNAAVRTPNLDRLAAEGTSFDNAYCNCPICVPSRASFATGRYVHETRCWDNAQPYVGQPQGWGHRLIEAGRRSVSIGKLHYRNDTDPTGFDEQILPLHVLNGTGDGQALMRSPPPKRPSTRLLSADAGKGESTYLDYDRKIRDAAVDWIGKAAASPRSEPWCLFVSFVCPHFPLIAPPEFFDLYDQDALPLPQGREPGTFPDHPVLKTLRATQNYEDHFRDERHVRTAINAYYGMVSFLDDNIGRVVGALDRAGLKDDTVVVYSSDHGDNLGAHTLWGKSTMYEESAGVPLIVRGAGLPAGRRVSTPATLVDSYQTILEATGVPSTAADEGLPGRSLLGLAAGAEEPDRTAFCEYHAVAAITGYYMIRWGNYKYVHFEGYAPQLFDLAGDPGELTDLSRDPAHAAAVAEGERRLRAICDPTAVNALAFADQKRRIEELGGVDRVMGLKSYPYTPAPGEAPRYA